MKGFTKKILSAVLTLTLLVGLSVSVPAATWKSYLASSLETAAWDGAAFGSVKKNTDKNFQVVMERTGWGGVWSCQMSKPLSIKKGSYYVMNFQVSSSKVNKFIYVKVAKEENLARGLWVKLPRQKTVKVNDVFKAGAAADQITFGLGGDIGDRFAIEDGKVRYPLFTKQMKMPYTKLEQLDSEGDFSAVTEITVKNFSLIPAAKKVSFKAKAKGKKKVKVTLKKAAGIKTFEIKVGKVKKKTTKTSITIKAKKKGKQKVQVRGISADKGYKTKWATKKVKVK